MATKTKASAKTTKTTKSKKASGPRTQARTAAKKKRVATPTTVGRIAAVLPSGLRDVKYVKRTLEILDARARKAERLNAQTKKDLAGVAQQIEGDVKARVDRVVGKAQRTKVGRTVRAVPRDLTKALDRALERVGLVRKRALS